MPTTPALTGSIHHLARWFESPRDVSGNADDFEREELLEDCYTADRVACHGDTVLVRTKLGACIITVSTDAPASVEHPLVWFDHVSNGSWNRRSFWYNLSSVKSLGEHLRGLPRASFDALLIGADA